MMSSSKMQAIRPATGKTRQPNFEHWCDVMWTAGGRWHHGRLQMLHHVLWSF